MDDSNGTRHRITFGTDGWRAPLSEFTTQRVRMVAGAIATFLDEQQLEGRVAIGYDAREHSRGFAEAVGDVLTSNGREVILSDRDCPTPALAWTVATGDFAGGVVITASHNPPEYNGIKFLSADGSPALPDVTDDLERLIASPETTDRTDSEVQDVDILEPYLDGLMSVLDEEFDIDRSLDDLEVAYDAMHGSGRGVTDTVLERAGATVTRNRCDRDPEFGGTAPEPLPENTPALLERVRDGDADLGLVNDGDADRVGIVTPERGFLDPNVVLAVVYDFLLEHGDGDVVRTVPTSSLVDRIAAENGQTVHETQVGFKWVADAMKRHDVLAGGEESGGYGISAHLPNKDGVLVGLVGATAHSEKSLDERIDDLYETYGEIHQDRVSLDCPNDLKADVLGALEADLPDAVAGVAVDSVSTVDGFKLVLDDGTWILVRPSGTEPKLRLYAEATSQTRVAELLDAGRAVVEPKI